MQIEAAQGIKRPDSTPSAADVKAARMLGSSGLLLFPEALFAAFAALAMPVWLILLVSRGQYLAAAWALLFTCIGLALAHFAWRHESKGLLYVASLVLIIAVWGAANGKS